MSVTQLPFDTARVFDGSVDAIDGETAEVGVRTIFKLPIKVPTCPLARSTVSFSPVTAYTK
eukprot:999748-Pleurochrysis_carterae.AAC.1